MKQRNLQLTDRILTFLLHLSKYGAIARKPVNCLVYLRKDRKAPIAPPGFTYRRATIKKSIPESENSEFADFFDRGPTANEAPSDFLVFPTSRESVVKLHQQNIA